MKTGSWWSAMGLCLIVGIASLCPVALVRGHGFGNDPPPAGSQGEAGAEVAVTLSFDPNDYNFLVYDPNPNGSVLKPALDILGITHYEYHSPDIPLSDPNFAGADILIVGWNEVGSTGTSGLNSDVLRAGITGRIILTGHDADYHTVNGPTEPAATFFAQAHCLCAERRRNGTARPGRPVNRL